MFKSLLFITCGWLMLPATSWSFNLDWLADTRAELARVSLDEACPNNVLEGVKLKRAKDGLIQLNIAQLSWDLSCGAPEPAKPSLSAPQMLQQFSEQLAELNLPELLAEVPLLKVDVKQLKLFQQGKLVAAPWALTGSVTADAVNLALKSSQDSVSLTINKTTNQFSLTGHLSPNLLHSSLVNLPASITISPQITAKGSIKDPGLIALSFTTPLSLQDQLEKAELKGQGQIDLSRQQLLLNQLTLVGKLKQGPLTVHELNLSLVKPAKLTLKQLNLELELVANKNRWEKEKLPDWRLESQIVYQPLLNQGSAHLMFSSLMQAVEADISLAKQRVKVKLVPGVLNLVEANQAAQSLKALATTDLSSGSISYGGDLDYQINKQQGKLDFTVDAKEVTGVIQDFVLENARVTMQQAYKIEQNALISVKDTNQLEIDLLHVGIPLSAVKLNFKADINQPEIRDLHAMVLGGELSVKRFKPLALGRTNVRLKGVELAGLLDYAQLPGATATGVLDAKIPLVKEADGFHIYQGDIHARAPGGLITIPDSEEVQSIAGSTFGVEFIFKVLQDLRYSDLTGKLNYQPDGDMDIEVTIKGRSPHISKTRPVEFNYSHQENLIQLLRSLRFSNELERKIEDKYL